MPEDDSTPLSHADRARAAEPGLTRWLVGRAPSPPEAELRDLADVAASLDEPGRWDRYGEHGPVAALERRLADLLGKPAVAMFPSGVMAQQSMLRVWCDAGGSRRVAMPALSHLLRSEADGPRLLHGLEPRSADRGPRVPGVDDLAAIPGPLGAALLELPLREAGLPPALVGRARGVQRGLPVARRTAAPRRRPPLGVRPVPRPHPGRGRGAGRQRLRLVLQGARRAVGRRPLRPGVGRCRR